MVALALTTLGCGASGCVVLGCATGVGDSEDDGSASGSGGPDLDLPPDTGNPPDPAAGGDGGDAVGAGGAAAGSGTSSTGGFDGGGGDSGCPTGTTECAPGECVDLTTAQDHCGACNTACPSTQGCLSGACVPETTFGNDIELTEASHHLPDVLLGNKITIPQAGTLTKLCLFSKQLGPNVRMSLYTDVAGEPGALIAETDSLALPLGQLEIPVVTPAAITAGDYWIFAVFDAVGSVGILFDDPTDVAKYVPHAFGSPMVDPYPMPLTYTGQRFNYFVKVAP